MCLLPSSGALSIFHSRAGMLPKAVADDLRQGRTAEAQSFSNATVYFRCGSCMAILSVYLRYSFSVVRSWPTVSMLSWDDGVSPLWQ